MQISRDTVVSINYELSYLSGKLIEKTSSPMSYLHGGYQGIFPVVESALEGKRAGDACEVLMEPEDAFGDYNEQLVIVEPRERFPGNVSVGMHFEGAPEGSEQYLIYTVTDVADDRVVVDGNHPLAGKSLVFNCTVTEVREASSEELAHGHVHGPGGHHH
ncbi:MAG: FKBP-type peptidyl-prolyl cis-trans isomerase [Betaproteobacteria bacterium]|jgi:FKBP-type peptidyl-prolyl cis-trans isomerase SlyD|nr:MAG: FKBP-type peptidyl-prolyl cis-trans isomerase [Betaproteobacteria bacterium]